MRGSKNYLTVLILFLCMAVLILDAETALTGAKEGLSLCTCVVFPSLFPYLYLSAMLPSRIIGRNIKGVGWLCDLCGVPKGAESLMVLGFFGGYPVGAGMIADAYRQGAISKESASRMLGFCNNAGPAFIFGMVGGLFQNRIAIYLLWLIHIVSALLVGIVLPDKVQENGAVTKMHIVSASKGLENSIKTMSLICGWIVIFKVLIAILSSWFLWLLPEYLRCIIYGLLELSNGIIRLMNIENCGIRFVLCSGMLAFGGSCVHMQTQTVIKDLGTKYYFTGKILQCLISLCFSMVLQRFLFSAANCLHIPLAGYALISSAVLLTIIYLFKKKTVAYPGQILYNDVKSGT